MGKLITIILLLILAALILNQGCTTDIKTPDTDMPSPTISIPETSPSTQPIATATSPVTSPAMSDFPFIPYGEGEKFLNKPWLFTGWTQNEIFYGQVPYMSIAWGPALPANQEEQKWFSGFLKNKMDNQINYVGASITPMHQTGNSPPPLKEFACIDIEGNPIYAQKPGLADFEKQYWLNLLNPGWQETMLKDGRTMIDMGIQGVIVDESTFNQQVIFERGGTFDPYSMEGFTHFLKTKYSDTELKTKFGINNIDTFDFKEYILSNNLRDTWNKSEYPPIPITWEFSQFQLVESARFWQRYTAELKEYAKSRYNREFLFSMSASPSFAIHAMPTDMMDYLTAEQFYFQKGSSIPKAALALKMTQGLTQTTALLVEVNHDLGKIPSQTKNMFKYFFADIYSGQGTMITDGDAFKTMDGWNYLDNAKVKFDIAEAQRYLTFANDHQDLFGLSEPADIGFVYSLASCKAGAQLMNLAERTVWTEQSVKGIVQMLLNLNVPSGLIYSGDGELVTRTFTRADLDKFKVILLPAVFMASDEEVAAITDYVKEGGKVIQINAFATHDKRGNPVNRADIQTLASAGEHKLGKGHWFTIREDLGERYYGDQNGKAYQPVEQNSLSATLQQFKDVLNLYYAPAIETTAPISVNIRRYSDGQKIVIHLVNYSYDQIKDVFTQTSPFDIKITLLPGNNPTKAILHDFEKGTSQEIAFDVNGDKVTITVPTLYAYSILELR